MKKMKMMIVSTFKRMLKAGLLLTNTNSNLKKTVRKTLQQLLNQKRRREIKQRILVALVPASKNSHPNIQQTMMEELENWRSFDAYGQESIDRRWVVNRKEDHNGLKVKVKIRFW